MIVCIDSLFTSGSTLCGIYYGICILFLRALCLQDPIFHETHVYHRCILGNEFCALSQFPLAMFSGSFIPCITCSQVLRYPGSYVCKVLYSLKLTYILGTVSCTPRVLCSKRLMFLMFNGLNVLSSF